MSEGAAGRRVTAARVCQRFPEAFALVAGGELHLSALCALAPHLDAENANELFEACRRKTRRQVDELLAARFPKPDVREQIRRLPGCKLEPLSAGRFGVHFTADGELRDLIERALAISSHALPEADLASLMKLVFTQFVKREEARRFAVGRKPRTTKPRTVKPPATNPHAVEPCTARQPTARLPAVEIDARRARGEVDAATTPPGEVTRHIPAAVRREVYARDQGQCSFVAADGRRCEARGQLELDHVEPWARGGASDVCNVRLRCRAHNQLHARSCFGALHIAAKVAVRRRRARRSRPGCSRAEAAPGAQVGSRASAGEHEGRG